MLGPVRTCSDLFGYVHMRSDAFGSVRTISENFKFYSVFSKVFDCLWTCSDLFGPIRMRSEAFRCIWMRSDVFGNFRNFLTLGTNFFWPLRAQAVFTRFRIVCGTYYLRDLLLGDAMNSAVDDKRTDGCTDADGRRRTPMDADGRRHADGRRRTPTDVDGRRRTSTDVDRRRRTPSARLVRPRGLSKGRYSGP